MPLNLKSRALPLGWECAGVPLQGSGHTWTMKFSSIIHNVLERGNLQEVGVSDENISIVQSNHGNSGNGGKLVMVVTVVMVVMKVIVVMSVQ